MVAIIIMAVYFIINFAKLPIHLPPIVLIEQRAVLIKTPIIMVLLLTYCSRARSGTPSTFFIQRVFGKDALRISINCLYQTLPVSFRNLCFMFRTRHQKMIQIALCYICDCIVSFSSFFSRSLLFKMDIFNSYIYRILVVVFLKD